jgi:hypothetical protein
MIDDGLIQRLKAYIKKNYELIGKPLIEKQPDRLSETGGSVMNRGSLGKLARGMHSGPSHFEELTETLSRFIKKERKTETFSVMLDRLRTEKGMTPAQLYNGAWINKQLYSKIMGERNYHPSKNTVLAFGFSLKLNEEGMGELLESAGYMLSSSSILDLVVLFCLEHDLYDLHDVNALLLSADQKVLCRE